MTLPGRKSGLPPAGDDSLAVKAAIQHFESAWKSEPRPRIDDYLPASDELRNRLLVELVHLDLELRLKAGDAARVEEYLVRYPELVDEPAIVLDLISAELELRRRREPGLALSDYILRFPKFRFKLLQQIGELTLDGRHELLRRMQPQTETPPDVAGYEIESLLGRGGMGVVYKARQSSLDRSVALKLLPEECARDPLWLARFRREARTASTLNHPHICTIYDTGESAGRPFLSMELVEGKTLETLVGQRRPIPELVRLVGQAAGALATAHASGVVHRDIKPANLMVRDDGILKVLDFGLARVVASGDTQGSHYTDPGTRVGTPLYMSPEQAQAAPVDSSTDIFSLGLVLYELVTGQHPFRADSEVGVLHAIVAQTVVPAARLNPEIPGPLDDLIQHMLAKDPRLRPTALEVEATLTQFTQKSLRRPATFLTGARRRPTVGRQQEWTALRAAAEEAAGGRGLVVCVTGEPGLGKTTLVEGFLDELAGSGRTWSVARGHCSERLAGAEAYLPFLDALDSLLQGEFGASAAQAMKLLAPTWYIQLAPLAADDPSLARVLAEAKTASQERRKRELGVLLQEVARQRPLAVFLDDVHWADPSSVDLLAYLGSKCTGLRLLVILTYRPSDLLRSQHPFGPVKLDLQGRGVCREIALPFLNRQDVNRYLALAFAGHRFPAQLGALLHARTEGSPLFMVDLLSYLRDRGVIVQNDDGWSLVRAVPELELELPESVRGMIQRKIDQLSEDDRRLLMAASVQGPEFDSAVVARLLGQEAADVEERLAVVERVHVMVRLIREQSLPDGTLTLRYGFVHVLYQNALYAALQPTRKASWSAGAARALLEHHGDRSRGIAAELALLFEAARDHERAADHYLIAAENAGRVFAHHEAVALARRGLELLQTLPETPERIGRELALQLMLGVQLQISEGYAAPEAERTYARARILCERVPGCPLRFRVLWGLWMFRFVRSELAKTLELAEQLLALGESANDPAQVLQARQALVVTYLGLGDSVATREHLELAMPLYDLRQHSGHADLYGQDPGVVSLSFGALALWFLGYPDQALQRAREAIALSEQLGQPGTLALAHYFAAILHQYRREPSAQFESARAMAAIAAEHGLSFWRASSLMMEGWALAEQGARSDGIAQFRQGFADFAATGAQSHRTYHLALLAEALHKEGDVQECRSLLAEAMTQMQRTGESFHAPELHRLQGELFLHRRATSEGEHQAEECFHQALAVARKQQARSLELRTLLSLTRLYQKQSRPQEARPLLADCYARFTEGLETPDLREARALLDTLERSSTRA